MMDENRVFPAFATPILNITWPDHEPVNAQLAQIIRQLAPAVAEPPYLKPAGWRSHDDLLQWDAPAVAQLTGWIQQAIAQTAQAIAPAQARMPGHHFQVRAWASVFATGNYDPIDDQSQQGWAGIYVVDPGDPAGEDSLSGVIQIQDPRLAVAGRTMPGDQIGRPILIRPHAGRMLMFPGWLQHATHPYQGARPRITVNFNVSYAAETNAPPSDMSD